MWAITIHEFAHGWVAHKCGDDTALYAGRLTLNPLAHLDLFGTLCFLIMGLGWAKPVPVNPYNFRNPRRDDILVSLAGVSANFLSAVAFAVVFRLVWQLGPISRTGETVLGLLAMAVQINIVLIIFNIIPIPPLDGSHVLEQLLPWNLREVYNREIKPYGMFILIGMILILPRLGLDIFGYIIVRPTLVVTGALLGY